MRRVVITIIINSQNAHKWFMRADWPKRKSTSAHIRKPNIFIYQNYPGDGMMIAERISMVSLCLT